MVPVGQNAAGGSSQFRSPDRVSVAGSNEVGLGEVSRADPRSKRGTPLDQPRRPFAEERLEIVELLPFVVAPEAIPVAQVFKHAREALESEDDEGILAARDEHVADLIERRVVEPLPLRRRGVRQLRRLEIDPEHVRKGLDEQPLVRIDAPLRCSLFRV